jgi:NAD(P)H-flavin reductase
MEELVEIIQIRDETHDVKTFRLKTNKNWNFVSGQYFLASLTKEEFKGEKKPFTFSSSPLQKEYLEFTIKKMGKFTAALHSLNIRDKIFINGPFGNAMKFDDSIKEDIVFIAGGSGIVPFMSALRYSIDKNLNNHFYVFFSNRTYADIIFRDELFLMSKRENMTIVNTLSDQLPDSWDGEQGRISKDMLLKYVAVPESKIWYICGPPPMVRAMKDILSELNVPEKNLRVDKWEIPGKHDNSINGGELK